MNIDDEDDDLIVTGEGEDQHNDDEQQGEAGEDDELVVEIEGFDDDELVDLETPPDDETPLQRKLRLMLRDEKREKFALKRENDELKAKASGGEPEIVIGEKPTLESCEWDEEKFETELTAWQKRKTDAEKRQTERQQVEQEHRQRFDTSLQTMRANAARIAKPEVYQEAEAAVGAALPMTLGNMIPMYCGENAPALVLLLHKRPDLLAKVVEKSKTDLVGAMFDLRDMSKGVKMVKPAKKQFEREEATRGSASVRQGAPDKTLERLEAEAAKNGGDRSKVIAYKAEQRKKAA